MLHRIGFAGGGYCRGAERGARDAAAEGYACPRIPQRRPPRESRAALTSIACGAADAPVTVAMPLPLHGGGICCRDTACVAQHMQRPVSSV